MPERHEEAQEPSWVFTAVSGLDKGREFGIEKETEPKAFETAHINAAG